MIRNGRVRFYIGIVHHAVGVAALLQLGLQTGHAIAFLAAALLFSGSIAAGCRVWRDLHVIAGVRPDGPECGLVIGPSPTTGDELGTC